MTEQIEKKKRKVTVSPEAVANSTINAMSQFARESEQAQKKQLELDEKYRNLYVNELERNDKTKKQIILDFAKATHKTKSVPTPMICKHICEVLKGFANRDYIIECLPDEYKNEQMQKNRGGRGNPTSDNKGKKCPHCGLYPNQKKHEDGQGDSDQLWQIDISQFKEEDIDSYDLKTCRVFLHDVAPQIKVWIKEAKKSQ